jgi:peptidoglycan/LPS O-acetylase OafA/YrhL
VTNKKPLLRALTGLRFFAALHVVAYHYLAASARIPPLLFHIARYGYVGVSLFFVLSGFVLAYSYTDLPTTASQKQFWLARFARIYPLYLVALILSLPVFLSYLPSNSATNIAKASAEVALEASLLHAWTPWTACGVNCPGWSLSAEAFFYAVFPFFINKIYKLDLRQSTIAIGALWLISMVTPVVYLLIKPGVTSSAKPSELLLDIVIYTPLFHLPQFLTGVVVGSLFTKKIARHGLPIPAHTSFALTTIIVLAFLSALAILDLDYTLVNNGLFAPMFAALLYLIADARTLASRFLSIPLVVLLGQASYATYILQYPLAGWFSYVRNQNWQSGYIQPGALLFFYTVILILLSIASYYALEAPAKKWILSIVRK